MEQAKISTLPSQNQPFKAPKRRFRFNSFWFGLLTALFLFGLGFLIWSILKGGGVSYGLTGPNEVKSGETKEYKFVFNNQSNIALEDAEVSLNLPEACFNPENPKERILNLKLDKINPKTSGEETFSLLFFGEDRTSLNLSGVFRYRPKNLTSVFEKPISYNVIINGSTFALNPVLPAQVLPDQEFPISVSWENQSPDQYNDVRLEIEWPNDFTFKSSVPVPSQKDNLWYLGTVAPAMQNKIDITGFLTSSGGEGRKFVFKLMLYLNDSAYLLTKTESILAVVPNPLQLTATVNGDITYNADPGETLNFRISYRNNYSNALNNVIVKATLDGSMFDFSSVKSGRGFYNSKTKTIIWNSANTPNLLVLNPGETGDLTFSINVSRTYPIKTALDRNFVLLMKADMDTSTIPQEIGINSPIRASVTNTIKINTVPELVVTSFFRDAPSQIFNEGNLPLRVDKTTQFTIHFKIKNPANALKNVTVKTVLPTWSVFTHRLAGNYGDSEPSYNERTGELIWTLPDIPAGSGFTSKAYELIFQIAVTPSSNQVNTAINLINETTLSAQDAFTLKDINLTVAPVRSDNLTDTSVLSSDGIVRP